MEDIRYNSPVILYEGLVYKFPDFTLEYLGTEKIEVKEGLAFSPFLHVYKVTDTQGTEQTIKWSSGTGLLSPVEFEVQGIKYTFEPYGTPTLVKKSYNTSTWDIIGFVVSPNFASKIYILCPVLAKRDAPDFVFMLSDPDTDLKEKLGKLSTDTKTLINPDPKNISHEDTFLKLEKPKDFLNHGSHLFFVLKDKVDTVPIDEEIIKLYATPFTVHTFYGHKSL